MIEMINRKHKQLAAKAQKRVEHLRKELAASNNKCTLLRIECSEESVRRDRLSFELNRAMEDMKMSSS